MYITAYKSADDTRGTLEINKSKQQTIKVKAKSTKVQSTVRSIVQPFQNKVWEGIKNSNDNSVDVCCTMITSQSTSVLFRSYSLTKLDNNR